jgi:hypothetical protein
MNEGSATGVLVFYFTVPVNFDESYRARLVSVAQHCAQALDRGSQPRRPNERAGRIRTSERMATSASCPKKMATR